MDEDLSFKKEKLSDSQYLSRSKDTKMELEEDIEEIELSPVETIVWDCTEAYLEKNLPRLLKDIVQGREEMPTPKRKKSYGK